MACRRAGCGHDRESHRHLHRRTYCAWCACPEYQPPSLWARLKAGARAAVLGS
jgi:hypothetical protein